MAELTINTEDIASAIRKNLEGFEPEVASGQVGRVVEVGDGIARISGLPNAAVNEMLPFDVIELRKSPLYHQWPLREHLLPCRALRHLLASKGFHQ